MKLLLDGTWKLYYALETDKTGCEVQWLRKNGEKISAQVPGNVELDLFRAGKEPDPFYAQNIYRFRQYEFYTWQLEKDFIAPEEKADYELIFEGINCFADVYLNDCLLGSSANALIEHHFNTGKVLKPGEKNTVAVRIHSAINKARHMDLPTATRSWGESGDFTGLRMPPSSFGWDIMGRFVSAGLWRSVSLQKIKKTRITETYYTTRSVNPDGSAELGVFCHFETDASILDGFSISVHGECGNHTFDACRPAGFVHKHFNIRIPDAQLWWPKGYGPANLYTVTLTLEKEGMLLDSKTEKIGIRRLEIDHCLECGEKGEFKVLVNGCPILCKGSNWVPLDAFHSRDAERLQAAHDLLDDCGCNIVRCWGGNVYEDHDFFDLCDERGMLVWQDFCMACAVYPQSEDFFSRMREEAVSVVKKLRNHPSVLLWAGDNEVDECLVSQGYASEENRYNAITREVLPNVIRMYDPYRVFLPSSPYIPAGMKRYQVPEQHNWGARAYFKDDFYKHSTAHFISECGYHGCPAVSSLRKFIPEEDLHHRLNNDVWDTHNTDYLPFGRRDYNRIQLMQDQVGILFGSVPEDLEDFARLSQISQAEAKKFFIEHTRLKKWRRTGVIWWNLLDGWPQISDAVVDYHYAKKLAYYYIRRVQRPVIVMMDELTDWTHDVVIGNDSRDTVYVRYRITDGDSDTVLLEGEKESPANKNVTVGQIKELAGTQKLYLITWEINGKTYGNHYISGFPRYDAQQMICWVEKIRKLPESFDWTL